MQIRPTALAAAISLSCGAAAAAQPEFSLQLNALSSYVGSGAGQGGTGIEIVAYDAATRRVFAINAGRNSLDVVDLADPAQPARIAVLDFGPYGGGVNGVAVHDGLVAVASEARVKTGPGSVVFLDAATLDVLGQVPAGALPDMLTFTPDGEYLLVANEGEPSEDYAVDPVGSVARVPSNAAQDFEPEYITVQGPRAYVTLQENNAVAVLDIGKARIESILPLGFKDHSLAANRLDASDRDGPDADGLPPATSRINIRDWPVHGMFQPDSIATLKVRNEVFLLTANEGDARVYPTAGGIVPNPSGGFFGEGGIFNEEVRVGAGAYALDPAVFPNAATLKQNANLGRLTVTNTLGALEADSDSQFERIYAFGARSFSVWDPRAMRAAAPFTAPNAGLVWDSGDQFEQITASAYRAYFNASNSNETRDDRSDNKGPEPEGITVGRVGPRDYAFIGLERIGTVMVYDVTNPRAPEFLQYLNTRRFGNDALPGQNDTGAEGLSFIAAEASPTGRPLLLVGNEVSQTLAVFEIEPLRTRR